MRIFLVRHAEMLKKLCIRTVLSSWLNGAGAGTTRRGFSTNQSGAVGRSFWSKSLRSRSSNSKNRSDSLSSTMILQIRLENLQFNLNCANWLFLARLLKAYEAFNLLSEVLKFLLKFFCWSSESFFLILTCTQNVFPHSVCASALISLFPKRKLIKENTQSKNQTFSLMFFSHSNFFF